MTASDRSLFSLLKEIARYQPDKKLLGWDSHWLTAGEVLALTEHIGTAFQRMKLAGKYVAFRCTRTAESAILMLGLRTAGVIVVLTDPHEKPEAALCSTEMPISVDALIEQIGTAVFRVSYSNGETPSVLLDLYALPPSAASLMTPRSSDPAFIIFTSGSTGKNKAVVLSEKNLISNLLDSQPLGYYQDDDLALGALPLHHVFGLVLLCGIAVLGYAVYFPEKVDIDGILSAIQSEKLTRMNGVPSLYLKMAEQADRYDLSSLRAGFIGGSPVTLEQFTLIEERLGITLIPVYGMSECIGIACGCFEDPQTVRASGVGPFYSMNTGRILLQDGSEAAPMQEGEICVNGPARMLGYYGQPMASDVFLHTGDLGYVDNDNILHLTGRKKDIIIRNGNNLSPRRIEQALLALPGVREAIVAGVPDAIQGEVPAAMIICDHPGSELHPALNKNELPVFYHFADSIPMTSSGKPNRQKIREVLIACRNG